MKKLPLILAALALTLGLSQCKKQETPTADEGVFITLTAGYGNGAKTDFAPATGSFVWTNEATEYIYVGGSNHTVCLGVLSGTGNGAGSMTFSGNLTTTPSEGETLHFFYLGKGRNGSAVSTLDFSNQSGTLESLTNYHIAIGDGSYSSGTMNYATTLNMAVSFAYFDVNDFKNASNAAETVYLHGDEVYSTATINYKEGTITGDAKGNINLGTASNGKYVALIPSVSTETTVSFDSNSKWGALNFMRGIQAGRYYSNSGAALTVTAGTLLAGTVPGLFSVSDTKMVRFSKGNLQYIGSAETPYWKFADNQWDYLGDNGQGSTSETADRDLFGWGTSGYHNLDDPYNTNYQPWSTSSVGSNQYNFYGYGPSSTMASVNLTGSSANYDWGINNPIHNGGNTANLGWYTPSEIEWDYLLKFRKASMVNDNARARFAKAYLFGTIHGIIVFSNSYVHPDGVAAPTGINALGNTSWDANQYNATDWEKMEIAGAVFLPLGGIRAGTTVNQLNQQGWYWSSTIHEVQSSYAYALFIDSGYCYNNINPKSYGISVRLVHNAGLIVNTDIINDVTAGGSIFSGWTNDGGNPWDDPTPSGGGNTFGGGWTNDGNNPWGN